MSFLFYIAVGLIIGAVYEAGRGMNYDMGLKCWLTNGIVIAFYGTIGYWISKYAYLAHIDPGFGPVMTIFLAGIALPFVVMAALGAINIIQNGH